MKQLIVNADDLGICESTNRAIAEGFRRGILTSASLMANGPAFDHALQHVVRQNPELGVGLHVCLTNARSLLPPEQVPLLVDGRGRFRRGFLSLYRLTLTARKTATEQIEHEIAAQFEALKTHGVSVDHVDSHRHVHMIPTVFKIVTRLARRHHCPAIRISHEPFPRWRAVLQPSRLPLLLNNISKKLLLSMLARKNRPHAAGLCTADRVVGILNSGRIDLNVIEEAIASPADGVTEIVTHPGGKDPDIDSEATGMERRFLCSPNRHIELLALVAQGVRERIDRSGCSLVRYSDLAAQDLRASEKDSSPSETCPPAGHNQDSKTNERHRVGCPF